MTYGSFWQTGSFKTIQNSLFEACEPAKVLCEHCLTINSCPVQKSFEPVCTAALWLYKSAIKERPLPPLQVTGWSRHSCRSYSRNIWSSQSKHQNEAPRLAGVAEMGYKGLILWQRIGVSQSGVTPAATRHLSPALPVGVSSTSKGKSSKFPKLCH